METAAAEINPLDRECSEAWSRFVILLLKVAGDDDRAATQIADAALDYAAARIKAHPGLSRRAA